MDCHFYSVVGVDLPPFLLVQVLHPGLVHQVQMDLFLMKLGSHIIGLLPGFKWLSLTEIVEEFEKLMLQQVCAMPRTEIKLFLAIDGLLLHLCYFLKD